MRILGLVKAADTQIAAIQNTLNQTTVVSDQLKVYVLQQLAEVRTTLEELATSLR